MSMSYPRQLRGTLCKRLFAGEWVTLLAKESGIHTIGIYLNLSAGWGEYRTASGCTAFSGGHFTLVGVAGGGGSSPTTSASLGLLVSNASKPSDLRGPFALAGGSVDLGLSLGRKSPSATEAVARRFGRTKRLSLGLDLPIPFEAHRGVTYTWTRSP